MNDDSQFESGVKQVDATRSGLPPIVYVLWILLCIVCVLAGEWIFLAFILILPPTIYFLLSDLRRPKYPNPLIDYWLRQQSRQSGLDRWSYVLIIIVYVLTGGIPAFVVAIFLPVVIVFRSALVTASMVNDDLLDQVRTSPLSNAEIADVIAYSVYRQMRPFLTFSLVSIVASMPACMYLIIDRLWDMGQLVGAIFYFLGLAGLNVMALAVGYGVGLKVRNQVLTLIFTVPIFLLFLPPILLSLFVLLYPPSRDFVYDPVPWIIAGIVPYVVTWLLFRLVRRIV